MIRASAPALAVAAVAAAALLLLRAPATARAQSPEEGRPLTRVFNVPDHHGAPQVNAAIPLADGTVAFTTASYLVRFDGREWLRIAADHPNIIHSGAVAADGRVYAGAVDHVGFFAADERGEWRYESLDGLVPAGDRHFGAVVSTRAVGDAVWFGAYRGILRWENGVFRAWSFTNAPGACQVVSDGTGVWLNRTAPGGAPEVGPGWYRFTGADWEPELQDPRLASAPVLGLWPLPEGDRVVLSQRHGLLRLRGRLVEPFAPSLAGNAAAYTAANVRADGTLLVAAAGLGVWHLDAGGRILRHLDRDRGLSDATVLDLAEDAAGTVWMASNNGITAVDLLGAVSAFDAPLGVPGGLCIGLLRHEGRMWYGALDGLHVLHPAAGTNHARFHPVPGSPRAAHQPVSHPTGLIVSQRAGLLRVRDTGWETLLQRTNSFLATTASRRHPGTVFAGHADGIVILRPGPEQGQAGLLRAIDGLGEVRKILESPDGFWVITSTRGFVRVRESSGPDPWASASVDFLTPASGRVPTNYLWVSTHSSSLGITTSASEKLFRFDPASGSFQPFQPFVTSERPLGDLMVLLEAGNRYWINATLENESQRADFPLTPVEKNARGEWVIARQRPALGAALGDVGTIRFLRDESPAGEILWASGFDSLLRIDTARLPAPLTRWEVHLHGFRARGTNQPLPHRPGRTLPRFPHNRLPYAFTFAAHRTDLGADVRYQTRLVGWDDDWSPWSQGREVSWAGLGGGRYRFEVRAADRAGTLSPVRAFEFRVLPPPYLSAWAWTLYAVLFAAALASSGRWRARRAEARARALEGVVAERTRDLAAARDAAEEANRAKSRFLANMSHELRTPLNGILGFTQILAREPELLPRDRERLRVIRSSGDHLLGLINDVLDLAKVEAGRVELRPAPFHLDALLRDLEASFAPRAAARNLALTLTVAPGVPVGRPLIGDAQRLRQVLENLAGNAIKFTRSGSVSLDVQPAAPAAAAPPQGADTPSAPGAVTLTFGVTDTGPGLTPEDIARLFQPFAQALTGRPAEAGAGLGLAISQHLVGLMGGRIQVESRPGSGSRFHFSLAFPLAPAPPAPAPDLPGPRRILGYEGPPRPVLIVDDLEINRRLLREMLQPLGFPVAEAASGEAALAHLADARPQPELVILDLRMPGMDGLELTRRLRGLHGDRLRIVASSASVLGFNLGDALQAGADGFLPKPFREEQLLDLIQHQLRLRWRFAAPEPGPEPSRDAPSTDPARNTPVPPPPEACLAPLRAAARRGDIVALRRELAALREKAPEHAAFAAALENLAAGFRMQAIREFLGEPPET